MRECDAMWAFGVYFDVFCEETGPHEDGQHRALVVGNGGSVAAITWSDS